MDPDLTAPLGNFPLLVKHDSLTQSIPMDPKCSVTDELHSMIMLLMTMCMSPKATNEHTTCDVQCEITRVR